MVYFLLLAISLSCQNSVISTGTSSLASCGSYSVHEKSCSIAHGEGKNFSLCTGGDCNAVTSCQIVSCDDGYFEKEGQCRSYSAQGTVYYVNSQTGNDQNSGTSPEQAWENLDKVNAEIASFNPGDSVLFARGNTFYGSLNITQDGQNQQAIHLGAYGEGKRPIITGLKKVSNWNNEGNGIFSSTINMASNLNMVVVNDQNTAMGREPNSGWFTIDSVQGNTAFTDSDLASNPNWQGGEVVIQKNPWIVDRNAITGHTGQTITYTDTSAYNAGVGDGYFIQNHLDTLDEFGEWYADGNQFYIYLGNSNLQDHDIYVSGVDTLINLRDRSNIIVDGLHLKGANQFAIDVASAEKIIVQNMLIEFTGDTAIYGEHITQLGQGPEKTIRKNTIYDSNSNGIKLISVDQAVIEYNKVHRTALLPGMGVSGDNQSTAISLWGPNGQIQYNDIQDVGYIGVRFAGGDNTHVYRNHVKNYCLQKHDGGAIYTYNGSNTLYSNLTVSENITASDPESANINHIDVVRGIYLDDLANGITVDNNVFYGSKKDGMNLHNTYDISVTNNIFYNNAESHIQMRRDNQTVGIRDIEIKNNTFFSLDNTQPWIYYWTIADDIHLAGTGTGGQNKYFSPSLATPLFKTLKVIPEESHNFLKLAPWQNLTQLETNSEVLTSGIPLPDVQSLNGANKFGNASFDAGVSPAQSYNAASTDQLTIDTNSPLDGNALRLSYQGTPSTTPTLVSFPIGEIVAGQDYVLRFSMLGESNTPGLKVYLGQSGSPYDLLAKEHFLQIQNTRTENEVVFSALQSETSARIWIQVDEAYGELYFDNFRFHAANVSWPNIQSHVQFVVNNAVYPLPVKLNQKSMQDTEGNNYNNCALIPPYSAKILLKN